MRVLWCFVMQRDPITRDEMIGQFVKYCAYRNISIERLENEGFNDREYACFKIIGAMKSIKTVNGVDFFPSHVNFDGSTDNILADIVFRNGGNLKNIPLEYIQRLTNVCREHMKFPFTTGEEMYTAVEKIMGINKIQFTKFGVNARLLQGFEYREYCRYGVQCIGSRFGRLNFVPTSISVTGSTETEDPSIEFSTPGHLTIVNFCDLNSLYANLDEYFPKPSTEMRMITLMERLTDRVQELERARR
jgi:hypothetical protein